MEYQSYYYSAPFQYYKQLVTIRATQTTIEIFDSNRTRIASHQRSFSKRYVTDPAHMPEKHRRYLEAKQFDGYRYRSWAKNIGPDTFHVIDRMLRCFDPARWKNSPTRPVWSCFNYQRNTATKGWEHPAKKQLP